MFQLIFRCAIKFFNKNFIVPSHIHLDKCASGYNETSIGACTKGGEDEEGVCVCVCVCVCAMHSSYWTLSQYNVIFLYACGSGIIKGNVNFSRFFPFRIDCWGHCW